MKLFDATLDLARFAKGTEDYTVTSVDTETNTIECSELAGKISEYGGGTIWIRSGESAGYFGRIKTGGAQTIELSDDFTGSIAVGDEITIGNWLEFDTQKLISAVNSVLAMYAILDVNTELVFDPTTTMYELPAGVSADVRRVQLQRNFTDDNWIDCHYWEIMQPRTLRLYGRKMTFLPDSNIRLLFVRQHGAVGKNDEISEQVDPLYLRYMSWLYLCRNLIQNTHKDNLASSDMYNEAKIYERDYGRLPNKQLPIRTFTFPAY